MLRVSAGVAVAHRGSMYSNATPHTLALKCRLDVGTLVLRHLRYAYLDPLRGEGAAYLRSIRERLRLMQYAQDSVVNFPNLECSDLLTFY